MKKFLVQFVLLILVIGFSLFFLSPTGSKVDLPFLPATTKSSTVQINGLTLKVEIADTQSKRSKGLGGRQSLASDSGMLFIFEKEDVYPFWMKGLSFPLDFIWIKGDIVVDILENAEPPVAGQEDVNLPTFSAKEPIDKVLEVNAGSIARLNIKIGDKITLTP